MAESSSIPFGWYKVALGKYATFDGRSRRAEYWSFALANVIISLVLYYLGTKSSIVMMVYYGFGLAMLIPWLSVSVRRLHDTSRSGWWMLLAIIPIVNLVLIVFMFMDGTPGANEYGPNPKT